MLFHMISTSLSSLVLRRDAKSVFSVEKIEYEGARCWKVQVLSSTCGAGTERAPAPPVLGARWYGPKARTSVPGMGAPRPPTHSTTVRTGTVWPVGLKLTEGECFRPHIL